MVNYYEEFGLNPSMASKDISEALLKIGQKWNTKQNSPNLERRQEAERKVLLISEAKLVFADENRRRQYDAELAQARRQAETQRQAQQQSAHQQTYHTQSQPDSDRSAYETTYANPSPSFKENPKLTGIVCYLHWIGWLIAYFAGDREGAKVHLNSAAVLFILSFIFTLAARLGAVFLTIFSFAQMGIGVLWIIGFIYAIKNEPKELPIIGGIHIIK